MRKETEAQEVMQFAEVSHTDWNSDFLLISSDLGPLPHCVPSARPGAQRGPEEGKGKPSEPPYLLGTVCYIQIRWRSLHE